MYELWNLLISVSSKNNIKSLLSGGSSQNIWISSIEIKRGKIQFLPKVS